MQKKKRLNNVAIGAFIFTGLFLFFLFIYFAGKFSFLLGGGYKLYIEYDFLDNLTAGAKVRVSGGPSIGYIDNINFETGKIVIEAMIDGKYKINRGANFNIYSTSLVGQKYINISDYNPKTNEFYTNNEYIIGVTPIGFARTIELAGAGIKSIIAQGNTDLVLKFKDVFQNTVELVRGLNHIVNDNSKDIRESIQNLNQALKNTGDLMARINNTISNIESGSKRLNTTLNSIDNDQIKSIVSNVDLAVITLRDVSADLKTFSSELNRLTYDKSSALNLIRDKDFKMRLDDTIKNIEETTKNSVEFSKKIKENPSSLFFSK